jgi:signal transduction histidine kinase
MAGSTATQSGVPSGHLRPQSSPAPAGRRPLFLSLRARLIASHSFVILLALAFVLLISAAYLRRYETVYERERIEQVSKTLTISTNFLTQSRLTAVKDRRIDAIDALAAELDIRLIVFRRDALVLYDSDEVDNLTGQYLAPYATPIRLLLDRVDAGGGLYETWVDPPADDPLAGQLVLLSAGGPGRQGRPLAIVAPPRRYPLLAQYLPRLFLVAGLSLAAASIAGYALSRRIAAPVDRLTQAANAMAQGNLEQQVPDEGPDELGRLVTSFNTMSRQVAATSRSQRELLANVAHELRTPLTSVQGYAQALRDGMIEDDADAERALTTIGRESDRNSSILPVSNPARRASTSGRSPSRRSSNASPIASARRQPVGRSRYTLKPIPVWPSSGTKAVSSKSSAT